MTQTDTNPPVTAEDTALRAVELMASRLLFWGGLLSLAFLAVGLIAFLVEDGLRSSNLIQALNRADLATTGAPHVYASLAEIRVGLHARQPLAVAAVGIVMLLAVPFASIVSVLAVFVRYGDYRFALVAFIVLVILALSLFSGGAR